MKLSIKQLITTSAIILISTAGFSQAINESVQNASVFLNNTSLQDQMKQKYANLYNAKITGTPYYDENFTTANISPLGKVFSIRYNAALDDMEILQEGDTLIMNKNDKSYVIKQHKSNITYRILEYADSKNDKLGYYVQLTKDAKITLYRKDRKKFVEIKTSTYGSNQNGVHAKFKDQKSEFYVELNKSGNAIEFPRKKKDILKMFPGKEDLVEKFIKKNKIKVTKEESLKELIMYINSI